jgi:hypothetical protein
MKHLAIHSVPRSGSTWLGCLIDSSQYISYKFQPLFSYAFKDYLNENSNISSINDFFTDISTSDDDFLNQVEDKRKGIIPKFHKTPSDTKYSAYKEVRYHNILSNLLEKDDDLKVIGLIRNPMAVLNSWIEAPREFRKDLGWTVEEEWRYASKKNGDRQEEYFGYEKWKESTILLNELKNKFPKNVMLVDYCDIIERPWELANEIFAFIDIPISLQTTQFIDESRTHSIDNTYSVFSTKSSDHAWKNNLDSKIVKEVYDDLKGTSLSRYI